MYIIKLIKSHWSFERKWRAAVQTGVICVTRLRKENEKCR